MRKEAFIPGFDWVRIFGSIIIAMIHYGFFSGFHDSHTDAYRMLGVLVPTFFLMSGHLRSRDSSKEKVIKQVLKYGILYLIVDYIGVFLIQFDDYQRCGQFDFTGLFINFLKGFVCNNWYMYHLWFIPALLYPLLLNAFLNHKSRRVVIAIAAVLWILIEVIGQGCILSMIQRFYMAFPLLNKVFFVSETLSVIRMYVTGFLFTTLGFEICDMKVKLIYPIIAVIILLPLELYAGIIGLAFILLSVLFFLLIKKLPGMFLLPYHSEIYLFSCIMYFFHPLGGRLISAYITTDKLGILIIFTVFSLTVTAAYAYLIRKKTRKPSVA